MPAKPFFVVMELSLRDFLILIPIFNRDFFVAVRGSDFINKRVYFFLLAYKSPNPSR
jgi:hypothetical protein